MNNNREKSSEQILAEIRETKASLTRNVRALEGGIRKAVEGVNDSVKDKVDDVKKSLDVREHIRNNPWTAMLTAMSVGVAFGRAVSPSNARFTLPDRASSLVQRYSTNTYSPVAPGGEKSVPSFLSTELNTLKSIGLAMLAKSITELIVESVPKPVAQHAKDLIAQATKKLGVDLPASEDANRAPLRRETEEKFH